MSTETRFPIVLCSDPSALSETFVRRHIQLLNDGKVVVIGEATANSQIQKISKNAYKSHLSNNILERRLLRFLHRSGMPSSICEILWKTLTSNSGLNGRNGYFLFEFGYILVRNYDYALFSNLPFFVYFRGQDASELLRQPKYLATLKKLLPSASGAVFVSDALRRNLLKYDICLPRSIVIPSGVETNEFFPLSKKRKTLVSIGRFVEKKSHHDTLRALRLIVDKIPEFHLTIVGDGPLFGAVLSEADRLNLRENVTFAGERGRSDIARLLQTSEYYVQSSKPSMAGDTEGFPSAIQEALASGCVVCSTKHAGAGDFLTHRQTAMLCEEGNFEEMAENVISIEYDPVLKCKLMSNARDFAVTELDAEICVKQLEVFVDNCLQEGAK